MISNLYLVAFLVLLSVTVNAQNAKMPIEEIIENASQQTAKYSEAFKNLLAEEVKVFETFDKNGKGNVKRTVGSTLIVYGLQNAEGQIVEFRNVTKVDGKPVPGADARARTFFEKITTASNSAKERKQLADESLRFDPDIRILGFTLFQAIPLSTKVRGALEFTRLPDQFLGERKVIVLEYRQVKSSPAIVIITKGKDVSTYAPLSYYLDVKLEPPGTERLRGTVWIDAETFQTRREIREITAHPENFPSPVVLSRTEFNYADSPFEILTPASIVYSDFDLDKKSFVSFVDLRVTFSYSKFSRADVEIGSAEVEN